MLNHRRSIPISQLTAIKVRNFPRSEAGLLKPGTTRQIFAVDLPQPLRNVRRLNRLLDRKELSSRATTENLA